MHEIRVHDKTFIPYLSQPEIEESIKNLAQKINQDYADKCPLFIAILNGAFMFAAELFKSISIASEISFIKLASYKGTTSSGHVITSIGLDADVKNKHIIILEDIIDTGKTMSRFLPQLYNQQPASLKIAALLHKPEATTHEVPLDYNCFKIPNKFVVGFGLDYNGMGRNIPAVYKLKE
ncbi:MAG: hypoxanthine phosphoribosyltransferase [Parafilimonas sp.]|nr:hypoxanthine phosphoribosyltransferase [Parafilimonas sp.]